jgi:general secretion pathway protein G
MRALLKNMLSVRSGKKLQQHSERQHSERQHNERGLTLVEIMVVLIILGIVTAMVASRLVGAGDRAKRDLNMVRMQTLKQSINMYQLRYNSFPPNLEALVSGTPEIGASFQSVANSEQLRDQWGKPFLYALKDNGRAYDIKTLGADGAEGGSDVNFDDVLSGP